MFGRPYSLLKNNARGALKHKGITKFKYPEKNPEVVHQKYLPALIAILN